MSDEQGEKISGCAAEPRLTQPTPFWVAAFAAMTALLLASSAKHSNETGAKSQRGKANTEDDDRKLLVKMGY